MSYTIQMPALGESVTDGTITRWLKQVGDHVEVDEPLLEISTDKVDTEIPSPQQGVLQQIVAEEDETVEVGSELAVLGGEHEREGDDSGSEDAAAQPGSSTSAQAPESTPEPSPTQGVAASGPDDQGSHEGSAFAGPSGPVDASTETPASDGDDLVQSSSPYATPLVRKLAAERGVDLSTVTGTGAGGRIRKQDVVMTVEGQNQQRKAGTPISAPGSADTAHAPEQPSVTSVEGTSSAVPDEVDRAPGVESSTPQPEQSSLGGTTQKLSPRRATIARRMVESLQVSAQLTTVIEADLTRLARLRDRVQADFQHREGVKLSFLPFMALATIEALKTHPLLNASVDTDQSTVTYHSAEHLGIAVDSPNGLLVPVIRHAGDLNLGGLARKIADVAERTRANTIAPEELSGGTFTLTNTGSRGALIDTPIINQPEVGILGTGAVVKKPSVVADGEGGESIAIRSTAYLCLSYDHRLVDGADAARFLNTIKTRLEAGKFETELGL